MIMNGVSVGAAGTVDRKNQEKLYIQVMRPLVDEIGKGTWEIGDRIPSEGELSARYAVSKITIRQALTNLTADGYLVRVQGKGTFVAGNRPVVGLTMKTRFTEGLFGGGVKEEREGVERGLAEPPAEVSRLLGTEGPLYRIATRRLAEGIPVSADESFVPPGLLPGIDELDLGGFRLFEAIQERGTRKVFRMRQTVEITSLSAAEAAIVGAQAGQPALAVHRLLIGPEDQPLGYSRIVQVGHIGKTGDAFLVNKEGLLQTKPRFSGHILNQAYTKITNSTIAFNNASDGGGIYNVGNIPVEIDQSILAENQPQNCIGPMLSSGGNLDSGGTCAFPIGDNLINIDPLLDPLKDNSGPTLTHALLHWQSGY